MPLLIVVVLVLVLLAGGPAVVERITNGARVGPDAKPGPDGIIRSNPSAMAMAAGMPVDAYALARMMASEHGSDGDAYLRAVGWAVKNKARERGVSVLALLTAGAGTAGDGYFGEQKAAAGTKYASTARNPSERHARIAREVTAGGADTTGGATHFYSPRAQDSLAAKAAAGDERFAKYEGKDAAAVDASWRAPGGLYPAGAERVVPVGIDARTLTLYRRLG